jgi:energy-coupling factor transport system ATP-binding protein
VEDEVTFALKNFGFEEDVIKSRVKWALTLLHLTQYRTTSPFLLSGGERKRVAIASVLAWNPQILILDEPTIGQDYRQKERLRQLILQMNTQNKTVIIVTHDVEFVAECKPRVLLMRNGQIVADGEAKKILTNPEVLIQASILPPEIVQVFLQLPGSLQSRKIIDIYEAQETLLKILRRNGH